MCKWQFAQELLSTFGTTIGEIALQPSTGGIFTVHLTYRPPGRDAEATADPASRTRDKPADASTTAAAESPRQEVERVLLWDRKAEGGFPETKVLKQRVRDFLEPGRDLGHSDRGGKKKVEGREAVDEGEGQRREKGEGEGKRRGNKVGLGEEGAEVKRDADGTVCEDCK